GRDGFRARRRRHAHALRAAALPQHRVARWPWLRLDQHAQHPCNLCGHGRRRGWPDRRRAAPTGRLLMRMSPRIVEREATPYAAVPAEVRMPFGEAIGPLMDEAAGYLDSAGAGDFGPAIFRYTVIDMPRLEMEFGFLVLGPVDGNGRVHGGMLPAGRYVTATYFGHY